MYIRCLFLDAYVWLRGSLFNVLCNIRISIMKSLIQPFELLGVATNSSVQEVRKAYYRLALLCHPDKGGDPKDMRMVQDAYEWIMAQIEGVDSDYTYEDAQQEFDDFIAAQNKSSSVPPFSDIVLEANGLNAKKIREWYNQHKPESQEQNYHWFQQFLWREIHTSTYISAGEANMEACLQRALEQVNISLHDITPATIPHGYGSYIESAQTPHQRFPTKEVIVYQEQQPMSYHSYTEIQNPEKLDDYSTNISATFGGYDYCLAYTDQSPSLETALSDVCQSFSTLACVEDSLNELKKERDNYAKDVATSARQNMINVVFGEDGFRYDASMEECPSSVQASQCPPRE